MENLNKTLGASSSFEPLHNANKIGANDLEEAQKVVAEIFCPHELSAKSKLGVPDFKMNHLAFGKSSSLNFLKYGSEVSVCPGHMEKVFNVQVQLTGQTLTTCGDREECIETGLASVLSPSQFVTMDWSADSAMLIYSVSRDAMTNMLQNVLGGYIDEPILFDTLMDSKTTGAASFWRALQFLQTELEASDQMLNSALAVEHFEQSLMLSLLYGQRHNYSDALSHGLSAAAPVHVKRVEDFIRANAKTNITIEDLTRVSGVSARTLFEGFKRFRGTSPMKFLREVRLQFVHEDLISAAPGSTVTEIAMKWGFCQLGRFSVAYKKKFGQSPSQSLKLGMLNAA